ncbi:hypothetical protein VFPBJ_00728 [Purpureocillium lilacinum]|uniref:Uncharacterized protein n=1 Tax=Purpureocillium lilacinum TaxID=33203 RepID=A0A179HAH8_PURLI|nr:hypothetical protein VFPBJ_00728 [Purpureocillium lilacinum]
MQGSPNTPAIWLTHPCFHRLHHHQPPDNAANNCNVVSGERLLTALKSINHASVLYQTSQPEGFCLNPSHSSASRHFELLVVHISLDARVFSPVSCYSGPRRADGLFASSQARFRRP